MIPLLAPKAIEALERHLRAGDPLPGEARDVILAGLDIYLAGNETCLDRALGLKPGPGQRSARTMAAISARDDLVRAVAMRFWPEASAAERASRLHQCWTRYAATGWLRERALSSPPDYRAGTIEAQLWAIMRGRDLVLTERSIRKILAASSGYSLPKVAPMLIIEATNGAKT